ncbi:MAG: hypothetical protein H0X37_16445 [Herpetosiphonaceae bacterium]|nr:hypothetical protein [Herpetosiphonaceae bacterium]
MNCRNIVILLATRHDLSATQEREVQLHVNTCPACAAQWKRDIRTSTLLAQLPVPPDAAVLRVTSRTQLKLSTTPFRARRHWRRTIILSGAFTAILSVLLLQWRGSPYAFSRLITGHLPVPPATVHALDERRLYIGSLVLGRGVGDITGARVTAIDVSSHQARFVIGTSYDAVLSANTTRLYVADGQHVTAYDAQLGNQDWQVTVQDSPGHMPGGPSTLVTSPDDRWLYIASFLQANGENGPGWLQIVDTTNGHLLAETVKLPGCIAPQFMRPRTGNHVYMLCLGQLRILNTGTQQIEYPQPLNMHIWESSVVSADDHWLYLVTAAQKMIIFDTVKRVVSREIPLGQDGSVSPQPIVALSSDGATLVVAQNIRVSGNDSASLFRVIDTHTWQVHQFRYEEPIATCTISADGTTIYAAALMYTASTQGVLPADTIVAFNAADGQVQEQQLRPNEDIQRLLVDP